MLMINDNKTQTRVQKFCLVGGSKLSKLRFFFCFSHHIIFYRGETGSEPIFNFRFNGVSLVGRLWQPMIAWLSRPVVFTCYCWLEESFRTEESLTLQGQWCPIRKVEIYWIQKLIVFCFRVLGHVAYLLFNVPENLKSWSYKYMGSLVAICIFVRKIVDMWLCVKFWLRNTKIVFDYYTLLPGGMCHLMQLQEGQRLYYSSVCLGFKHDKAWLSQRRQYGPDTLYFLKLFPC